MPWFKVDDKHHDHRKTRRALRSGEKRRDAAAVGLWSLAGSWSADNLMDGFVPTDELLRWDDDWECLAARLVDAEFWEPATRDGEDGFQFINWDEHQPMKADVEAKREAARERMRSVRSKGGRGSGEVRANEQANSEGTSREVRSTPSRPVPSRPVPKDNPPGGGDAAAQSLIAEWIEHCGERPPGRVIGQVAKEVKAMLAEGIPYADVRAGLQAWHAKGLHPSALASVVHETRTSGQRTTTRPSTTDQRVQVGLALAAKYAAEEEAQMLAIEGEAS